MAALQGSLYRSLFNVAYKSDYPFLLFHDVLCCSDGILPEEYSYCLLAHHVRERSPTTVYFMCLHSESNSKWRGRGFGYEAMWPPGVRVLNMASSSGHMLLLGHIICSMIRWFLIGLVYNFQDSTMQAKVHSRVIFGWKNWGKYGPLLL